METHKTTLQIRNSWSPQVTGGPLLPPSKNLASKASIEMISKSAKMTGPQ
jgi:hypothetical protein